MELSPLSISIFVVVSCLVWTSLYGLFCCLFPQRSYEWNCRAITFVHAVTIVVLSYIFGIYYNPWPFTHPGGKSSFHEVCTMIVCLGYFLFDFGWCLWFRDQESGIMLLHHLITIVGIVAALLWERSGTEVGATIFGAELSNPFLQLRFFMREAGWKGSLVYELNDFLFLLTFTVCRMGIGTYFLYCELMHPLPALFFKVGAVALYLVSWTLMASIVLFAHRKYTKMFRQWTSSSEPVHADKDGAVTQEAMNSLRNDNLRMRNGHLVTEG